MEWSEETIVRLRALWSEGLSTAEIGRRLGVSKNAVVGKAHRLVRPARPAPIKRDGGAARARPAVRRIAGPTLPPLPSAAARPLQSPPARTETRPLPPRPVASAPSAPSGASRIQVVARPYARVVACCWPMGEPGTKTFRFCDAGSVPGKPYCVEHAQLAYVKVRDRREDAA